MNKTYLEASGIIKGIMDQGFRLEEAIKIYKTLSKDFETKEDVSFVDELFLFGDGGWVRAIEAYAIYIDWTNKNNVNPISNTKFGIILSKVTRKTRKTDGIYYEMSVK